MNKNLLSFGWNMGSKNRGRALTLLLICATVMNLFLGFMPASAQEPPAIQVVKSSSTTSITAAGQVVPYTFTVTNEGSTILTGVTVADPLCNAPAPGGEKKYDFGTPGSPVAAGYTAVTEATAYAGAQGWTDITTLESRDRGAPDALLQDLVFSGSAARVFKVALSNGSYSVNVRMGDQSNDHDNMVVKANGALRLADVDAAAGAFANNTFSVSVTNGFLELEFSDAGGTDASWVVNAVAITPVAPAYQSGDTNTDGKLDLTETWIYTCSHTVTQAEVNAGGSLSNTATADSIESDPDTDMHAIPVARITALTLDKTIFSGNPYSSVGGTIVYHYLVTNSGNVPLPHPVTITDDQATDEACPNTNTVGNNDGFLDPGESLTCTASHAVSQADLNSGSLTNYATAHAGQTNSNQDQATANAAADLTPVLTISKTANVGSVAPGGTLSFTIRIEHAQSSKAAAMDVVISDVLPWEVDYVSGPICNLGLQAADAGCSYDAPTRTITARWNNFSLTGGAGQISFVVRANGWLGCGRDLSNFATVRWSKVRQGSSQTAESRLTLYGPRRGDPGCPGRLPDSGGGLPAGG